MLIAVIKWSGTYVTLMWSEILCLSFTAKKRKSDKVPFVFFAKTFMINKTISGSILLFYYPHDSLICIIPDSSTQQKKMYFLFLPPESKLTQKIQIIQA